MFLWELFQIWWPFFVRKSWPKYIERVKKFIPGQLDVALHKNLSSTVEDFDDWWYNANHDIELETYLGAYLAYWLSWRVFANSSTVVLPETFLVNAEMV